MTKTSAPRTLSSISTHVSPSLKCETFPSDKRIFKKRAIASARGRFAFPENNFNDVLLPKRDIIFLLRYAGAGGFEPPNARSKAWRLTACRRPNLSAGDKALSPSLSSSTQPATYFSVRLGWSPLTASDLALSHQ